MTHTKRKHDDLREMVDDACAGVMPQIAERIKDAARRAYYLGCGDALELARSNLAQRTIENHKTVVDAHARRAKYKSSHRVHIGAPDELQKQRDHIDATLDRCRRCGDHTFAVLPCPPLSLLCGDCEDTLKTTDGKVMWFAQLVAAIANKEKKDGTD